MVGQRQFFSYALFPLIIVALRFASGWGIALLIAFYLAILEIASERGLFPSGHWSNADTMGAYRAFADFMIGAAIAHVISLRLLSFKSVLPGCVALGLAVAAMIAQLPWYVTFCLLALALTLAAIAETEAPDATAWLSFAMPVTVVSFGIYIWHPVMEFMFLTIIWDRYLAATGLVDFYVFWLLPMAATIGVAILSHRVIEPRCATLISGPRQAGPRPAPSKSGRPAHRIAPA